MTVYTVLYNEGSIGEQPSYEIKRVFKEESSAKAFVRISVTGGYSKGDFEIQKHEVQ